jgi:hypothetical protein
MPLLKAASKPHTAKRHHNPAHARAERKLLAAMREQPGLSSASLAKVVGAGLSTTKERLRRMGAQDPIEKAPDGPWQVKAQLCQTKLCHARRLRKGPARAELHALLKYLPAER